MKRRLVRGGAVILSAVLLLGSQAPAQWRTDQLGRRNEIPGGETPVRTADRWWVFFRDKGINSIEAARAVLGEYPETHLSHARRVRAGAKTDGLDLPVLGAYCDAVEATGARIAVASRWLNAVSVRADASQLDRIRALPFVAGVRTVARGIPTSSRQMARTAPDAQAEIAGTAQYPISYGFALQQIRPLNVPELHALGMTGRNVRIAVFDTGFRLTHDAFSYLLGNGRLLAKWDFIFADTSVANDSLDFPGQDQHGSMVLGTIAGYVPGELVSPAFDADFILAKTEDNASETPIEEDNYVAALEWADSLGADISTSSLSYKFGYVMDGTQGITSIAANTAASRGILLCTAMGNTGPTPSSLGAPADAFGIVAVGAVDVFGTIAPFSSRGPTTDGRIKPEVCAQGVSVTTDDPSTANQYVAVSGTSLSTPLTSSSASLLLQAHPDWTPLQLREALLHSGTQADAPDNIYGWGVFDLLRALDYAPFGTLQFQTLDDSDRYGTADWNFDLVPLARTDRLPDQIMLHYEYDPGAADSVAFTNSGDTLWTASLPFAGEQILRYYYVVTDRAGRTATFPATAPARQYERLRQPDSLTDGFEFGGRRWERGGTGDLWWVTASEVGSGSFALTDSPKGAYPADADGWYRTRLPLIVTAPALLQIDYDTRYQLGSGDTGYVEVQVRPGGAWEAVDTVVGMAGVWSMRTRTVAVSADDSVRVQFRLKTDAIGPADGWYIDDFRLGPSATAVSQRGDIRPEVPQLDQNYPNPFNPTTVIQFGLPAAVKARLRVYNVAGRLVRTLVDGTLDAGSHRIAWDGTDDRGVPVASGVYFYRLETDVGNIARKMILLR